MRKLRLPGTIVAAKRISDNGQTGLQHAGYGDEDANREANAMQENWVDVASIETVQQSGAVEVVVGGQIIALFWANDALFALDGMCAHQGGPIAKGRVEGGCVTCPWHGWQYELATGIQTINRQPLQRTYEVRHSGDRVEVLVPESK